MPTDPRQTAAYERLGRLRAAYRDAFPPERAGGCCVWALTERERAFLGVMVGMEAAAHAESALDDAFVVLQSDGAGGGAYAKTLGAEFAAQLSAQSAALASAGVLPLTWEQPPETPTLKALLGYVAFALAQLPKRASRSAVCLHPAELGDDAALAREVAATLAAGLPRGMVLMLSAAPGSALVARLGARADLGVTVLRPDLDLHGLAREAVTAHAEETDDAGARLRLLMVDISEYGASKDFARMREAGAAAEALCEGRPELTHLRSTALASQAAFLMASRPHRGESLGFHERAVDAARAAVTAGHELGDALLTQALLAQTAGLVHFERYGEALPAYEELVEVAGRADPSRALELTARRMHAVCLDELDRTREAYGAYEATLDAAEGAELEVRRNSILPYVGVGLIDLAKRIGRSRDIPRIEERMAELFGDDWREHLDPDA